MEPLVGQIMLFGGNFAPRGWAFCDGQLLDIESNEALFAILGTTYGGDGHHKFGLPDLRGRVPVNAGHGDGLTPRSIGQKTGAETVVLSAAQLPEHQHDLLITGPPLEDIPITNDAIGRADALVIGTEPDAQTGTGPLCHKTTGMNGGGAAHDNMQPSLCINYIIALEGTFPSRN